MNYKMLLLFCQFKHSFVQPAGFTSNELNRTKVQPIFGSASSRKVEWAASIPLLVRNMGITVTVSWIWCISVVRYSELKLKWK